MGDRWKGAVFGTVAIALALGGVRFLSARPVAPVNAVEHAPRPIEVTARVARSKEGEGSSEGAPGASATTTRAAPTLPRSLRGTEVDGALRTDANGNLIVGPEVAAFFEYFLSATGEEPPETIRARIVTAIRERLDGRAQEQATALLDRYLDYREATRRLRVDSDDPAARLAAIRQLRHERLGAEDAERLFGAEEREGEVAIETSRLETDPSLSPAEREARIAEIEEKLPDATREAREATRMPLRQQADEEALRAAGATAEELHAHRVATVGAEAASRLTDLDERRAAWTRRLDAFRTERAALAARALNPRSLRAEEDALLTRDFTPAEQLRVKAILSIPSDP